MFAFVTRHRDDLSWIAPTVVVMLLFGSLSLYEAHVYFTGEKTTAQVTRCETHLSRSGGTNTEETDCYGRWTTADGEHHTGPVDAGRDQVGTDVAVRADGGSVVGDSPVHFIWPLAFVVAGLALLVGYPIARAHRERTTPLPVSGIASGDRRSRAGQ